MLKFSSANIIILLFVISGGWFAAGGLANESLLIALVGGFIVAASLFAWLINAYIERKISTVSASVSQNTKTKRPFKGMKWSTKMALVIILLVVSMLILSLASR